MTISPEELLMDAVLAFDVTGAANGAESKQCNVVHGCKEAIIVFLLCFLSPFLFS